MQKLYSQPQISVIMPTYNRADKIGRSIESVFSQSFSDFELIIIDDGSNDSTQDVLAKINDPRIKILKQENRGVSAARNHGLFNARGRYIAYCDDDDILNSDHLKVSFDYLEIHPEIGIVVSDLIWRYSNGKEILRSNYPFSKNQLEGFKISFTLLSVMHRSECTKKVGGFDENPAICRGLFEDWDLWLRISDYYRIDAIKNIAGIYNVTQEGLLESSKKGLHSFNSFAYIVNKRLSILRQRKRSAFIAPFAGYYLMLISHFIDKVDPANIVAIRPLAKIFTDNDSDNYEAWLASGMILLNGGDRLAASQAVIKTLKLLPAVINYEWDPAKKMNAVAFIKFTGLLRDDSQIKLLFEKALELDPDNKLAQEQLKLL